MKVGAGRITLIIAACLALCSMYACKPDWPKCEKDEHCRDNTEKNEGRFLYCINGQCQECRNNGDCPKGKECVGNRCEIKPECRTDPECGRCQSCRNQKCVPECQKKEDCSTGAKCENNCCVPDVECTSDTDCPAGKHCESGKCIEVSARSEGVRIHRSRGAATSSFTLGGSVTMARRRRPPTFYKSRIL